jgi:alkaline phosphatase
MKISVLLAVLMSFSVASTASAAPSFTPLPLTEGANTAFADKQPDDRQGGWIDQGGNDLSVLKPGRLNVSGIPFDILGDAETGGKSCIVLGGPKRAYLPSHAEIPAGGKRGKFLYLLHAAAWCPPAKEGRMTGSLFVDYVGGGASEFHVRFGRDVGDWAKPDAYKNAVRVWTAYNANTQVSLFASRFELKDRPVETVRLVACESAWMVAAVTLGDETKITGIKPDLTLDKTYVAPALDTPLPASGGDAAPKNVILIIGDGMGPGALQLTSLYQHKAEGRLVMEQLPVRTRCHTLSLGSNITDSAASSTAFAGGRKTQNSHLGLTQDKQRVVSVAEAAHRQGRAVGIITSDAITGATPGGFYAHVPARNQYADIAGFAAASGYEILIGNANGRAWFAGKDAGGKREDARDLLTEMAASGYAVIEDQQAFDRVPRDRRVLGFMAKGTLDDETCLAKLTETAVARLSQNDKGFFLMVECTITDAGGHGNKPELTVRGTLQVDWAVKAAVDFARKRGDTLVMVTADHETGGLTASIADNPPGKLVIDYATTSHTAIPVRFLAYGPGAKRFDRPLIDNTDIARTVADLWSLGIGVQDASAK